MCFQALKVGYKRISTRANKLLRYITPIIALKPILQRHMHIFASYIGQNRIKYILQLEGE